MQKFFLERLWEVAQRWQMPEKVSVAARWCRLGVGVAIIMAGAPQALSAASSDVCRELSRAEQVVVVKTADWGAVPGTMQLFERRTGKSSWRASGEAFPVVVGRTGLAWGAGVCGAAETSGPVKREGDGKAPAGVFRLGPAFGFAPSEGIRPLHMDYVQITSSTECVDDTSSTLYNRIVDRSSVAQPDWQSSEKMHQVPVDYRIGVFVQHNSKPCVEGSGSCIFLHIWERSDVGTAGCTAMAPENMERVIRWLRKDREPLLVQLTEAEYAKVKEAWGLP